MLNTLRQINLFLKMVIENYIGNIRIPTVIFSEFIGIGCTIIIIILTIIIAKFEIELIKISLLY